MVKATVFIWDLQHITDSRFKIFAKFTSHDANYTGNYEVELDDLDGSSSGIAIVSGLQDAVKIDMENNGVEFGLLDTVRVLQALV